MKIRMLSTQKGSLDGIKVADYEKGEEYDLSKSAGARDLAKAFVGARMAVEITGEDGGNEPELPLVAAPVEQPAPTEAAESGAAIVLAAAPEQATTTPAPVLKRKGGK